MWPQQHTQSPNWFRLAYGSAGWPGALASSMSGLSSTSTCTGSCFVKNLVCFFEYSFFTAMASALLRIFSAQVYYKSLIERTYPFFTASVFSLPRVISYMTRSEIYTAWTSVSRKLFRGWVDMLLPMFCTLLLSSLSSSIFGGSYDSVPNQSSSFVSTAAIFCSSSFDWWL